VDLGVLLSLPVESIAIRVILATALCVCLARLVLRLGIRSSTVRVVVAIAPAAVLLVVAVAASTQLRLPQLFVPVDGVGVLPIRVADGYQNFSPLEVPLLIGAWAAFVVFRLVRRVTSLREARRSSQRAIVVGEMPGNVRDLALRVAADLQVPAPTVTVVPSCPGGAYVVGTRKPVIILDRDLVARLDHHELEGVIAHELAHVRRRDNSVATLVGIIRDMAFFVPGIGWAARQLHRERELAADQVAVGATGRPGALAGGLLKVLEVGPGSRSPCAAFAPHGSLVDRVTVLVDDRPPPTGTRRRMEVGAAAVIASLSVVIAMIVPTVLAGPDRERDAVALVWSTSTSGQGDQIEFASDARAFDVYRRSTIDAIEREAPLAVPHDEHATSFRRSTLHACGTEGATCPSPDLTPGLGMRPQPVITVDDTLTGQWRSRPVVNGGGEARSDGFRLYWLALRD
jgi:beta-lactamase regulating signal transducer with metallopeptidase domain